MSKAFVADIHDFTSPSRARVDPKVFTSASDRSMAAMGVARPSGDPAVRAAFLLVNDLALILLRNQVATVIGADPLSPKGITRWASVGRRCRRGGAVCAPSPMCSPTT